jgi:hypothetical protein
VPVLRPPFDALDEGGTRIAKGPDGSEIVPAEMTYYEWLKTQPAGFQDDAIGPVRGRLLQEGGLTAKQFSDWNLGTNFTPLTLDEMKAKEPEVFDRVAGNEKDLHSGAESGILNAGDSRMSDEKDLRSLRKNIKFYTIRNPEYDASREGDPRGVYSGYAELNARQKELLEQLPNDGDWLALEGGGATMNDLSVLTVKTKNEFTLFEKGPSQLIARGNAGQINIKVESIKEMVEAGYKWIGHTHTDDTLYPSDDDLKILKMFGQRESYIYNIKGESSEFYNSKYEG